MISLCEQYSDVRKERVKEKKKNSSEGTAGPPPMAHMSDTVELPTPPTVHMTDTVTEQ